MSKKIVRMSFDLPYPQSEQTIVRNNYYYKGLNYINDRGIVNEYRIEKDGKDLNLMVKYYKGQLLAEYKLIEK